jgi:Family of unknown function (DUF6599)
MRKKIVVFVLFAVLRATGVSAQNAILPDHFGNWQADGPAKTLRVQDLRNNWAQWTDGDKVLAEAQVSRIEERSYKNGDDQATFRVFTLKDPSSAYEFYTFLLAAGMRNMGVGQDSALSQYDGRFLVGNLVVQATLSPKTKPESLNDIVSPLKAKADPTPMPPLKGYLPETWRVFGTEKYALGPQAFLASMTSLNQGGLAAALGPEIGFQDGAETMMARYQGEHGSGILLLIEYPTPQLAENHLRHIEQALPAAAKQAGVTVERKASLLSLVFAATSPMHAQAIRNEVNYVTEVTWNEPSQTATDPPLVYVMFKIFLFTSLFLVFATIAGIAFGGFRVLIKHWLPGKVFDRPKDIEVLQMGLSGKKIDPTDMY